MYMICYENDIRPIEKLTLEQLLSVVACAKNGKEVAIHEVVKDFDWKLLFIASTDKRLCFMDTNLLFEMLGGDDTAYEEEDDTYKED